MGVSVAIPVATGRKTGSAVAVSVGRTTGGTGADRVQALKASSASRTATVGVFTERGCERVDMGIFYRRCRRQSLPNVTVYCGEFRCKIMETDLPGFPHFQKWKGGGWERAGTRVNDGNSL
jgi:hypothetical protein